VRFRVRHLRKRSCLFGSEPGTKTNAKVLLPLDSPDASSKIRAEQAGISGVDSVAGDNGLAEDRVGSEQYQAMNSSIACRYPRWDSFEGRLFRTADLAKSKIRQVQAKLRR
jgi:hypothetical protein